MRVITFNIAGVKFDWFKSRGQLITESLKILNPDIVLLQETSVPTGQKKYNQIKDISQSIGLHAHAFSTYGNNNQNEATERRGIAILSRWPFIETQTFSLPSGRSPFEEERVLLKGLVDVGGQKIYLATTHLAWQMNEEEIREKQAKTIMEILGSDINDPLILGGDFNALSAEPAINEILKCLADAYKMARPSDPGHTWSQSNALVTAEKSDRRIDYIFHSSTINVLASDVVLKKWKGKYLSDHYGVMVDFALE
jgi:endonuclease/exonuclease/phosphatase family metal-dependent hydrolase